LSKPFAGFIRSSLDLFAGMEKAGTVISPPGFVGGASEVYPGHIWNILGGDRTLPKKSTEEGRRARRRILEALGVCGLPSLPTHDQNDACVSALLAAAADGVVPGVIPHAIGSPLLIDRFGVLREGPMVIPRVLPEAADLISCALHDFRFVARSESDVAASARPVGDDVDGTRSGPPAGSPDELLDYLIQKALEGRPHVCTYSWAYLRLFKIPYRRWSQAYAEQVIRVARQTRPRQLPGLGLVRLDAFVVSKSDALPSDGHWPYAHYEREDWERVLGSAVVLERS
jgi:hypothetical protein